MHCWRHVHTSTCSNLVLFAQARLATTYSYNSNFTLISDQNMSMERKSLGWIFAAVCAILVALASVGGGFYVLLDYGLGPVVQYEATLSWAKTNGTILSIEPTEHGYFCNIHYNYTVDNVPYDNNRTRTQSTHPYRLRRHRCPQNISQSNIDVLYDPHRPSRSALYRTFFGDVWLAVNILDSLALVSLGGVALFWVFQKEIFLAVLVLIQASIAFLATVPISVARILRRHALAVFPLFTGLFCAAVAVYCASIIGGARTATSRRALGDKESDEWWARPSIDRDLEAPAPARAGS